MDMEVLKQWRAWARAFSRSYAEKEEDFEQVLRERYMHWKSQVDKQRYYDKVVWAAIGLMTFGDKSVIEDVILNIPSPYDTSRALRLLPDALISFLPVPESLADSRYIRNHPDEMSDWFEKHKEQLIWNETLHEFILPE